jgi:hypothetical protein
MKFMTLDERKAAIAEIRKTSVTEAEAAVGEEFGIDREDMLMGLGAQLEAEKQQLAMRVKELEAHIEGTR